MYHGATLLKIFQLLCPTGIMCQILNMISKILSSPATVTFAHRIFFILFVPLTYWPSFRSSKVIRSLQSNDCHSVWDTYSPHFSPYRCLFTIGTPQLKA